MVDIPNEFEVKFWVLFNIEIPVDEKIIYLISQTMIKNKCLGLKKHTVKAY